MGNAPDVVVVGAHGCGAGVCRVHHMPVAGETIEAWDYHIIRDGGKGSHQAMVIGKYGGSAAFIGKLGTDTRSDIGISWLVEHHLNIDHLVRSEDYKKHNGAGIMMIDDNGDNVIVNVKGEIKYLTFDEARPGIDAFRDAEVFITGFEVPLDTALRSARLAKQYGMFTVLNPSPLPHEQLPRLDFIDLIIPNQTESKTMLGLPAEEEVPPEILAQKLISAYGMGSVIITLGAAGAMYHDGRETIFVPSLRIEPVSSIGAGDCFLGSYVFSRFHERKSIRDAMEWAAHAAAISVSRPGSLDSFPTKEEVDSSF